ncbi:MAG: hypothetical protein BWK79_05180 [Beggiatoa sp. IS2]|nr:MAG: hypothetical protein BWK79_05180 [Beggiatoa sp. IS2]
MSYGNIFHVLGLHMHQPPGNLRLLIDANEQEALQIIHCYDRATRCAHKFPDVARLHIGFSGILLEQLRDRYVVDRYRHLLDIPAMLESYRVAKNIEFIGMGYHHPVFPLLPASDWEDQLVAERQLLEEVFGQVPKGFYPPEMAFSMDMIPALVKAGYEYVIIGEEHIKPFGEACDHFQPYKICYNEACITVIPRHQAISSAQANSLEVYSFANDVPYEVRLSPRPDAPRLLTTWTDGENDKWFRQMDEAKGFFGQFFTRYMEHVRSARYPVRPMFASEFLRQYPAEMTAQASTSAWQEWQGSDAQKWAVAKIREVSGRYHRVKSTKVSADVQSKLREARRLILESESSCFLFWGDEWVHKVNERMVPAEELLSKVEQVAPSTSTLSPLAQPVKPVEPMPTSAEKPIDKPKPIRPVSKAPALVKPSESTVTTDEVKPVTAPVGEVSPAKTASETVSPVTEAKPATTTQVTEVKTPTKKVPEETKPVAPTPTEKPAKSSGTESTKVTAAAKTEVKVETSKPVPAAPKVTVPVTSPAASKSASVSESTAPATSSAASKSAPASESKVTGKVEAHATQSAPEKIATHPPKTSDVPVIPNESNSAKKNG